MKADPGETTNLAAARPDEVARHREMLASWEGQMELTVDVEPFLVANT